MPNIWLCNMDELIMCVDHQEFSTSYHDVHSANTRNLLNLMPGDVALIQNFIDADFAKYCENITGGRIILHPAFDSMNGEYGAFVADLQELCRGESYVMRPYIQSRRAYELAQLAGADWKNTSESLINQKIISKINSKYHVKSLALSESIKSAPYIYATNLQELLNGIERFGVEHRELFIKKDGMCGGRGNTSGSVDELKRIVPSWYRSGGALIEPKLPVKYSLGSLFDIQQDSIDFVGIDEQFFEGYKWSGFRYPFCDKKITDEVKSLTLQLAAQLKSAGLLGQANFDWLVLSEDYPEAGFYSGDIILSECNFRATGVNPSLNMARCHFGSDLHRIKILSYVRYPVNDKYNSFSALYGKLATLRCNERPLLIQSKRDAQPGVVISKSPINGTCGITIFAFSDKELEQYAALLASEIT